MLAVAAQAQTVVTGNIVADTTWTAAGGPYVLSAQVLVNGGATLTIQAGTVVKVLGGAYLQVQANGAVQAMGTVGSPIVFTSLKDDSVGGDTNNDGAASAPAAGDWAGVLVYSDTASLLDHVVVRYAGGYVNYNQYSALTAGNGNLTVQNSTISDSAHYGIWINQGSPSFIGNVIERNYGGVQISGGGAATLTGNTIRNNGNYGIRIAGGSPILTANVLQNNAGIAISVEANSLSVPVLSGNTYAGNGLNGVGWYSNVVADTTWTAAGGPYVLSAQVLVNGGATLTIQAGTVVKVLGGAYLQVQANGAVQAMGTVGSPIVFTSLKDDSVGGDTNNDGAASAPAAGDWAGVLVYSDTASLLDHVVVRYAGGYVNYNQYSALTAGNGNLTVQNSTISDSAHYGIWINQGSPSFIGNVIERNYGGVQISGGGAATLTGNTIRNNGNYGIRIAGGSPILTANVLQNNAGIAISVEANSLSVPVLSGNTYAGNGLNGVGWYSNVVADTTWTAAGGPYVLSAQVLVNGGATLTIQAGTVVKVLGGAYLQVQANGAVQAMGTVGSPIVFTSLKDDSVGGDTNNDGAASAPAAGDWAGVLVYSDTASLLDHVVVRYAGGYVNYNQYSALTAGNGNLTVQNSTISDSAHYGIWINQGSPSFIGNVIERNYGGVQISGGGAATLTGNTIRNNGNYGIRIAGGSPILTANVLQNNAGIAISVEANSLSVPVLSGNTYAGNGLNGVGWYSNVVADTTWTAAGGPYVLSAQVLVNGGATLTIQAGTVVKVLGGAYLQVQANGAVQAMGTVGSPIVFTSLKDDSVGGDTNNDGAASAPAAGDWAGVLVYSDTASLLDHVVVRYAGGYVNYNQYSALTAGNGNLTVQNSTISDSAHYGIWINQGSPTIRQSSILRNAYGARGVADMRNNYWGAANGPLDGSDDRATGGDYNPTGAGNSVSDGIVYRPWLTTDPNNNPGSCAGASTLSGRVIDRTTNAGKSGATVTLAGMGSTTSGTNGSFSFPGTAPGNYRVTATLSGYVQGSRSVTVCNDTTANVDLTKSSTTNGLNSQSGYSADPVNTATGNYVFKRVDLKLPGKGMPFTFERTYNSQEAAKGTRGALGYGWTHNFEVFWTIDADGAVTIRWGDGRTESYASDGAGGFTSQYGVFDKLTPIPAGGYTLTRKNQTRYEFNATGGLAAMFDRNGNVITLTYTGPLLTRITDTAGRGIDISYDASGNLTQLLDPLGRVVRFAFDGARNLTSSTTPAGRQTTLTYDVDHQLLTAVDPRGNTFVSNTYDSAKRVVTAQRDAKGGQTTYVYDVDTRETTITDPLGQVSKHTHDNLLRLIADQNPLGSIQGFAYDDAGNRTSVTDRNGNVTRFEYDTAGNVTTKTDALSQVTRITYDSTNNPLSRTDAVGSVTTFVYDARGNLLTTTDALGHPVTNTYDASGLLLTLTDPRGNVVTNTFDGQGNLTQVRDALGNVTSFTYDAVGRLLTKTNARGFVTRSAYDADDNLVSVIDPAGAAIAYAYDGNNNRVTVTDRRGNSTTTAYDQKDLPTSVTDALGGVSTTAYDALDRKISLTDRRGNVTQFAYDAAGRMVRMTDALGNATQYVYDAQGNRTSVVDPLGHAETATYDALNRRTQSTDALGNVTTTGYDALGRVTSTTNAKGQTTTLAYDAIGQLIRVTDAAGGVVTYAYDAAGNRVSMTDPRGNATTYAYDALNRLITKTEPGGYVTSYAYDSVGNRARITKPNGTVIQYAYDGLERLTTVSYPDASQVVFAYDANGNRVSMIDSLGTTTYTFDALNRVTAVLNPFGKSVGYAYDAAANLTALVYPDGKRVTYAYDGLNRMSSVTDWAARTTNYIYDSAGRLVTTVLPNGTQTTYGYDNASRLTALVHQAGPTTIASYAYMLDPIGNHTQVTATEPLAPLLTPGTVNNTFDADNRLTSSGGTALTYDANGNLTAKGPDIFVWDYEDRLRQSTVAGVTYANQYDGTGNRLSPEAGGATTQFVLDVSNALPSVLAETDIAGVITAYYVYGLGLVERVAADGSVRMYHHDSRGSTVALTDAVAAITDKYAYDPFGRTMNATGNTSNPFRYVGRHGLFDEGNGLLHVRARYFDPMRARFLSKDPKAGAATDSQALHRYIYAQNNPVKLVDISGLNASEGFTNTLSNGSSDAIHAHLLLSAGGVGSWQDGGTGRFNADWWTKTLSRSAVKYGVKSMKPLLRPTINAHGFDLIGEGSFVAYKSWGPFVDFAFNWQKTYQDTMAHPERSNTEVMSRFFVDTSANALTGLAVASVVAAGVVTAPVAAVGGIVIGIGYAATRDDIQDAVAEEVGGYLGGVLYDACSGASGLGGMACGKLGIQ